MFDDTYGNGVLRGEQYLSDQAEPPQVVGREVEIHTVRDAVRPLTKGNTPETLLVHGPPGSGKTLCVNHVFDALESETSVKVVRINCWQYRTRPALLTELLIQLGYPAPRKGKPVDRLLQTIGNWLDRNRCVAVILDEFDQLLDQTGIIYDFHMLSQHSENKIGLVLISNLPPEEFVLDGRSWSRLNCQALEFKPYTAEELTTILKDRIEQAFQPGTVHPDVIERIALEGTEQDGDCRKVFDRLLRAGRQAMKEEVPEVSLEILEQVEG